MQTVKEGVAVSIYDRSMDDMFGEDIPDSDKEWKDMPEYEHEDMEPVRVVIMKFKCEEDVQKFAGLIGQEITPVNPDCVYTKKLWFPPQEDIICHDKRYIDNDTLDIFEGSGL